MSQECTSFRTDFVTDTWYTCDSEEVNMQRRTRRVPVNTRLDLETYRELQRIAALEQRTLSDVARRFIERGMSLGNHGGDLVGAVHHDVAAGDHRA